MEFKPLSGISDYQLQWKEYPAKWGSDSGRKAVVVQKNKCKLLAEDLTPGTTYCVRLTCQDKDPGPGMYSDVYEKVSNESSQYSEA